MLRPKALEPVLATAVEGDSDLAAVMTRTGEIVARAAGPQVEEADAQRLCTLAAASWQEYTACLVNIQRSMASSASVEPGDAEEGAASGGAGAGNEPEPAAAAQGPETMVLDIDGQAIAVAAVPHTQFRLAVRACQPADDEEEGGEEEEEGGEVMHPFDGRTWGLAKRKVELLLAAVGPVLAKVDGVRERLGVQAVGDELAEGVSGGAGVLDAEVSAFV